MQNNAYGLITILNGRLTFLLIHLYGISKFVLANVTAYDAITCNTNVGISNCFDFERKVDTVLLVKDKHLA